MPTKLEQEREEIKKKPKTFADLLELMRCHASMMEVYEYVDDFKGELEARLVNEKGLTVLNEDDSMKDVLIGIKELLGKETT